MCLLKFPFLRVLKGHILQKNWGPLPHSYLQWFIRDVLYLYALLQFGQLKVYSGPETCTMLCSYWYAKNALNRDVHANKPAQNLVGVGTCIGHCHWLRLPLPFAHPLGTAYLCTSRFKTLCIILFLH